MLAIFQLSNPLSSQWVIALEPTIGPQRIGVPIAVFVVFIGGSPIDGALCHVRPQSNTVNPQCMGKAI